MRASFRHVRALDGAGTVEYFENLAAGCDAQCCNCAEPDILIYHGAMFDLGGFRNVVAERCASAEQLIVHIFHGPIGSTPGLTLRGEAADLIWRALAARAVEPD